MVPPEDVFGMPTCVGVYLLSALGFGVASLLLYRRVVRLVLLGRPTDRFDRPFRRIVGAIPLTLGQSKVLQSVSPGRDRAGLAHVVIFWGFLSFLLSYLVFIYGDSTWSPFSRTVLTETGVKAFAVYIDILAVAFLAVLAWAVLRRWVARPHRLRFDLTRSIDAVVIIVFTSLLMLLTLATEALFVASGGEGPEAAVLVGSAVGGLLGDLGMTKRTAVGLHEVFWWTHLGVILGFGIYIPLSKHMHLLGSPASFLFRSLEPMGALETPTDLETAESFGAGQVREFTWKELLDGHACAVCGRCTDSCPAHISGKVLSPMHIVENLKEQLLEVGPVVARGGDEQDEMALVGGRIQKEALWDCVTCGACEQECPVGVEHLDTIVDMRRHLVMERATMPESGMNALMSMEQRGHPWRGTTFTRTDWTEGLNVKTLAEHPDAKVLFWVGCTAALEQRSQGMARAMASVLKRAGVDFAVLGAEEACTGDPARRMGNEYLYQVLARQNIETLRGYGVTKVVTICPHCFNTMKNEYPHLGGRFEVLHYSEYVAELIEQGRIKPVVSVETTVAYHDSCYLGRHNGVYDPPREIARAIPGVTLVEMERRRERGFCCGAGGGHMWMEESRGSRINHLRTDQFMETGADTVGVSCPFCLQMFEEGIGSKKLDGKRARDLLEILAESLGEQ